jgi:hypothetical protein
VPAALRLGCGKLLHGSAAHFFSPRPRFGTISILKPGGPWLSETLYQKRFPFPSPHKIMIDQDITLAMASPLTTFLTELSLPVNLSIIPDNATGHESAFQTMLKVVDQRPRSRWDSSSGKLHQCMPKIPQRSSGPTITIITPRVHQEKKSLGFSASVLTCSAVPCIAPRKRTSSAALPA